MPNIKIKLLKHWNGYPPGHVFTEMPRGMARVLVQRNFAKQVRMKPKKNVNNK